MFVVANWFIYTFYVQLAQILTELQERSAKIHTDTRTRENKFITLHTDTFQSKSTVLFWLTGWLTDWAIVVVAAELLLYFLLIAHCARHSIRWRNFLKEIELQFSNIIAFNGNKWSESLKFIARY